MILLAFVLTGLALGGGKAMAAGNYVGAVYVQTNTPTNQVQVFRRTVDGQLTAGGTVATGGEGAVENPPFGLAVTDSENSVVLAQNHHVLLVTNNASGTVSSFIVAANGNITLAGQVASGGTWPNSVAATTLPNGVTIVYVLNEVSETVTGFFLVGGSGRLVPIPGSERSVTGMNSATIGFDATGRVLTVTNRNDVFQNDPTTGDLTPPNGTISTFPVDRRTGLLGAETVTEATGTGAPFGFSYSSSDQLVVADAGQLDVLNPDFPDSFGLIGGVSSYDVSSATGSVTVGTSVSSGGLITCWAKVTNDGKYAYFTSPGTASITGFGIGDNSLSQVSSTFDGFSGAGNPLSPLDLDTAGANYLYVLGTYIDVPHGFVFNESTVNGYVINGDGSLTPIGSVDAGSGGNSGLASY